MERKDMKHRGNSNGKGRKRKHKGKYCRCENGKTNAKLGKTKSKSVQRWNS
jgi:hypothetical protein